MQQNHDCCRDPQAIKAIRAPRAGLASRLSLLAWAGALALVCALVYFFLPARFPGERALVPGAEAASAPAGAGGPPAGGEARVAALGRLEPAGEVVRLGVPALMKGDTVSAVRVREGDRVSAGQIICELDNSRRMCAALNESLEQVKTARARLGRVRAGAKTGEISAQEMAVAQLKAELAGKRESADALVASKSAELSFSQSERERYAALYAEGAVSASLMDEKRLAVSQASAALKEAKAERQRIEETLAARIAEAAANLDRLKEVRLVDVRVAEAEVGEAVSRLNRMNEDYRLSFVRAPRDGRILKLYARKGEAVGEKGVADFGSTDSMFAVAEIYESDFAGVRLGQRAMIKSDGLARAIHGTVSQLGWQVVRQSIWSQDPSAACDRRVVEVKVAIDPSDAKLAEALTNLQVEVVLTI